MTGKILFVIMYGLLAFENSLLWMLLNTIIVLALVYKYYGKITESVVRESETEIDYTPGKIRRMFNLKQYRRSDPMY